MLGFRRSAVPRGARLESLHDGVVDVPDQKLRHAINDSIPPPASGERVGRGADYGLGGAPIGMPPPWCGPPGPPMGPPIGSSFFV